MGDHGLLYLAVLIAFLECCFIHVVTFVNFLLIPFNTLTYCLLKSR
jgi:hypothetical protein